MKKIINPCTVDINGKDINVYCEIDYNEGRLSISGVVGPLANGNCRGSCGQIVDEVAKGKPKAPWDKGMLTQLCVVWKKYHLNDMRPYCSHQKELGWDKLATKEVSIYHWSRTREATEKCRKAEASAITALKNGETFIPTDEQVYFANLPLSKTTYTDKLEGEDAKYYEPKKSLYSGDCGFEEKKLLGFLHETEHPEGILGKECPVCKYRYGTKWLREEVPDSIIEILQEFPETKITPAWV